MQIPFDDADMMQLPEDFPPALKTLCLMAYSQALMSYRDRGLFMSNVTIAGFILGYLGWVGLGFLILPSVLTFLSLFVSLPVFGLGLWATLHFTSLYRQMQFHNTLFSVYRDIIGRVSWHHPTEPTTSPSLAIVSIQEVPTTARV